MKTKPIEVKQLLDTKLINVTYILMKLAEAFLYLSAIFSNIYITFANIVCDKESQRLFFSPQKSYLNQVFFLLLPKKKCEESLRLWNSATTNNPPSITTATLPNRII